MASFTELCTKHFNCSSLYEVLGVEKDCDEAAGIYNSCQCVNILLIYILLSVKRAYYKKSLKVHPDRVSEEEKENATEKFQTLGKVYSILSDREKRKIYDETGKSEIQLEVL